MLVALVGFALVELKPPVAVILAYYGLLFVLATPLLRLRAPVLAAAAAVWCVAGPALSHVAAGRPAGAGRATSRGSRPSARPPTLLRELAC